MAKVEARIELDADMWDRIDAAGERAGLTRDEFIDGAVRRALGGQALATLFKRVRERSDLTEEEAARLVASEKAAARAEAEVYDAESASWAQRR
jgi:hypothetical protein